VTGARLQGAAAPSAPRDAGPLLIEFVGLAGAGKSTLVAELRRRDPGITTLQRAREPRHALAVAGDALRLAPALAASLLVAPRFVWRSARYYLRLEGLRRVAREALVDTPGTLVLEHGPVFTLARIAASAHGTVPPRPLRHFVRRSLARWVLMLNLIVVLDAAPLELARRVRTRSKPHPMRHSADHVIHDFFNRYDSAYSGVLADVAAVGGPPVLTLRTDQESVSALADRVLAALEESRRVAR